MQVEFVSCWLSALIAVLVRVIFASDGGSYFDLTHDNPTTYHIGGVLSNNDSEEHFKTVIKVCCSLQSSLSALCLTN